MLVSMKKGGVLAYGAIIAILVIGSFVSMYITKTGPVSATIATKEGNLISFENRNVLLLKSFDLGIKFISQRATYDLGKTGGLSHESFWTISYPKFDVLKDELLGRIKDNLPQSYKEGDIELTWGEAEITIEDYDVFPCGPLEISSCFFLRGERFFSIYDDSIKTRTSDDYEINSEIPSSYFKLLYVGRQVLENDNYNSELNDTNKLWSKLQSDFSGLSFKIETTLVEDDVDVIDIYITDFHCHTDFSCLVPLKPGEEGIAEDVLYDYLTLHFKVEAEQTEFSPVDFDFFIGVDPDSGERKIMCT